MTGAVSVCPYCRESRERAELLEETLRQMREAVRAAEFEPPASWRLTSQEALLVRVLCQRQRVNYETLRAAMLAADFDWDAEPKLLDVLICKVRRKLAPFGVEVVTKWGEGFHLRPDQRAAVQAACKGGSDQVGPPVVSPRARRQLLLAAPS